MINSFVRANQQVLTESLRKVVMKVPQILDFDNKRLIFRQIMKRHKRMAQYDDVEIVVSREQVFDDSYSQMRTFEPENWRAPMIIEFENEQGIDEGGLTREWFILLSKAILEENRGLFKQSDAGCSYYPTAVSATAHSDFREQFRFIG